MRLRELVDELAMRVLMDGREVRVTGFAANDDD